MSNKKCSQYCNSASEIEGLCSYHHEELMRLIKSDFSDNVNPYEHEYSDYDLEEITGY